MRIPHNEPLVTGSPDAPRRKDHGSASVDPERKCVLTGDHGARDDLLRLAISPPDPDGTCDVLPDALSRAPGRGAWIGVSRADLETALAKGKLKGALARAFKGAALTIPADLPQRAETALRRAFTDRLGLEMKSGRLLVGSDRIAENARMGKVTWLAHACDAGEDGSRKLDQAWRVGRDEEGSGLQGFTLPLDRAALSVALGRENVVHLALTDREAAARLELPLRRLLRFLGQGPPQPGQTNEPNMDAGPADAAEPASDMSFEGLD